METEAQKHSLDTFDRHYHNSQRFLEIRSLFAHRDKLTAEAKTLNLEDDFDYGYFARSILPQIDSIDARLDILIGPEGDAEHVIKKYAKSHRTILKWDMREERALDSLKAAAGGIGLSAVGAILTGLTYLIAGPGERYVVFTGLMLAGLIGVGYSLLYWFPVLIRYLFLLTLKWRRTT